MAVALSWVICTLGGSGIVPCLAWFWSCLATDWSKWQPDFTKTFSQRLFGLLWDGRKIEDARQEKEARAIRHTSVLNYICCIFKCYILTYFKAENENRFAVFTLTHTIQINHSCSGKLLSCHGNLVYSLCVNGTDIQKKKCRITMGCLSKKRLRARKH